MPDFFGEDDDEEEDDYDDDLIGDSFNVWNLKTKLETHNNHANMWHLPVHCILYVCSV